MTIHSRVRQHLVSALGEARPPEERQLNEALRLLAKWRGRLIQNTLLARSGTVVLGGPAAGLDFLRESAEGCHVPKLLGCYEQPLHPHIESAIARGYPTVLNIGCAEGYYAVGMARRMPETRMLAFDTDPNARRVCAELAEKNGVSDRVTVGPLFRLEDFARHAGGPVLVLCDIEGGEKALLDPGAAPALRGMDLIVESHECFLAGITRDLTARFAPSHDIVLIEDDGHRRIESAPDWLRAFNHLDQLLATWEWRLGPTPWLVMTARERG